MNITPYLIGAGLYLHCWQGKYELSSIVFMIAALILTFCNIDMKIKQDKK